MKKLLLFFLVLLSVSSIAQSGTTVKKQSSKSGASSVNSSKKNISKNHTQNLVTGALEHNNCVKKEFSIVFYVVHDKNGSVGQATPAALNTMIDSLNKKFKPICVSFKNCSTVIIPNYNYTRWKYTSTELAVTNQYYTEKTINIYVVDSIHELGNVHPEEFQGYTYGPSATATINKKEIIVLEKWQILASGCRVGIHHMGHFFGLKNTHAEINPGIPNTPPPPAGVTTQELVNGFGCAIHGDGICDTEADPGSQYAVSTIDGNGQQYIRPLDNYMSHYTSGCRFTQQQYNSMAEVALTSRFYLH